jgi:uncharacterized membrane protein
MSKLEKSINVNAPIEKVFGYISERTNLPEIWPSLTEVSDMKTLPNGGCTNHWVYKMAGMRLEGTNEDVEYIKNERIVSKTKGGIDSTQRWIFQPEGGATKVTFEVEYKIPIPVLGKIAEAVIVKMNEHEGDSLMANLKARMEA